MLLSEYHKLYLTHCYSHANLPALAPHRPSPASLHHFISLSGFGLICFHTPLCQYALHSSSLVASAEVFNGVRADRGGKCFMRAQVRYEFSVFACVWKWFFFHSASNQATTKASLVCTMWTHCVETIVLFFLCEAVKHTLEPEHFLNTFWFFYAQITIFPPVFLYHVLIHLWKEYQPLFFVQPKIS